MSRLYKNHEVILDSPVCLLPDPYGDVPDSSADPGEQALLEAAAAQAEAETRADELFRDAAARGDKEGYEEGYRNAVGQQLEQCEKTVSEIRNKAEQDLTGIRQRQEEKILEIQSQAAPLGFSLAEKIIAIALERNESAFLGLFQKAAARLGEAEEAVLKTGPRAAEIAQRRRPELERSLRGVKSLVIQAIGEEEGLCVIETPFGSADASTATQLEKAYEIAFPGRPEKQA